MLAMASFSKQTIYIVLFATAVTAVIAFAALRARQYGCVSFEPGIRGEVMSGDAGATLYFNGTCWTRQPVAPTDTPL